jgi:sulfite reductase alpha subunit
VIPRFSEVKPTNSGNAVFEGCHRIPHPARHAAPGMHYDTATLRQLCDVWDKYGSGLIALHGQSGDIMMQGCTTENVQKAWDEINEMGFDLGGAGPAVRTSMSCVGAARCEHVLLR